MFPFKHFVTSICVFVAFSASAQQISKDTTIQQKRKLPVQAFAAMPILLGVSVENAFAHDRKYTTFAQNELTLPMKNGQTYTLHGSLPVIKKTKGFSAKLNFAYNVFKDNIGATAFNERVLIDDVEETGTSANVSFNVSQQFLFKKWKKKLTLAASFSTSGKNFSRFQKKSNKGIFSATLPLKMTADNMFLIGAVGIVGKNIDKPVLPIVAYFGRLGKHLNIETVLPLYAQFRYVISPKSTVMLGARFGTRTPFMDREIPVLQSTDDALEFKSQNLRYYLNAEKAVSKLMWLNVEVGYNRDVKAALITSNVDLRNRIFVSNGFGYTYAKVGLFLRPVWGTLKRQQAAAKAMKN